LAIHAFNRTAVAPDDILDALCLSAMQTIIQQNGKSSQQYTFPQKPIVDEHGIEMAIHYGRKH